jgi:hypothetical protein
VGWARAWRGWNGMHMVMGCGVQQKMEEMVPVVEGNLRDFLRSWVRCANKVFLLQTGFCLNGGFHVSEIIFEDIYIIIFLRSEKCYAHCCPLYYPVRKKDYVHKS